MSISRSATGKEPVINDENEEITSVLHKLNIKTGPFDVGRNKAAKKNLTEGKASRADCSPEVLRWCDLDNIILG